MSSRLKRDEAVFALQAMRAFTFILLLATALLALPSFAFATGPSVRSATAGATRVADPDTRNTFTNKLGSDLSTRYDGRVWDDKSVSTGDVSFVGGVGNETVVNDSDFLVTYSALATSRAITGELAVPVDVVFVIDNSTSMTRTSSDDEEMPIKLAVDAVNESITTLMSANPENRVAVVMFGREVDVALPLGHYTPLNPGVYLEIVDVDERDSQFQTAVEGSNTLITQNSISGRATNTQMGVYGGMDVLANAVHTSVTKPADTVKRVPYLVLLSDGVPTLSSDSEAWWDPELNSGNGDGYNPYYGNGFKTMLTATYMKDRVNENYGVDNPTSDYALDVYTVGLGLDAQDSQAKKDLSHITLNPAEEWNSSTTMAGNIRGAWSQYVANTGSFYVEVDNGKDYEVTHPDSNDITGESLKYNDKYFSASQAADLSNVFQSIIEEISVATPQVPTQVGDNEDPDQSGWIKYSDPIGDYMEVKDVKTIIYADQRFDFTASADNPSVSKVGDVTTTTYKFTGEIHSAIYGERDVSDIKVYVVKQGDGSETMHVDIPASAIPIRTTTVKLDEEGVPTSIEGNEAYPIRVLYTVGLREGINPQTLSGVSQEYIEAHTTFDANGKEVVAFYSNKYTNGHGDEGAGDSFTTFTPASYNQFYYIQKDAPVYTEPQFDKPASASIPLADDATYYTPVKYYEDMQVK